MEMVKATPKGELALSIFLNEIPIIGIRFKVEPTRTKLVA